MIITHHHLFTDDVNYFIWCSTERPARTNKKDATPPHITSIVTKLYAKEQQANGLT